MQPDARPVYDEPRLPSAPQDGLNSLLRMMQAWSQGQKPDGYSLESGSDPKGSPGRAGQAVGARHGPHPTDQAVTEDPEAMAQGEEVEANSREVPGQTPCTSSSPCHCPQPPSPTLSNWPQK